MIVTDIWLLVLAAALTVALLLLQAVALPGKADAAPSTSEVQTSLPEAAGGTDCSARSPLTCPYTNTFVGLVDALPAWSGKGSRPPGRPPPWWPRPATGPGPCRAHR